ncbi:MAG: nitroreductase family protein [Candidatus Omnitrophica bacterium]|nr:nitroreductase family protein [Candidatus Omnitrophota bacterium]
MKILILIVAMCMMAANVFAEGDMATQASPSVTIKLPTPETSGGKPLMQALKDRKSSRNFSDKELPQQVLSDLLWAAFGINRPDSGMRTAPTAHNMQEIYIFVAMSKGLYLYEPKQHILKLMLAEDIRAVTGMQEFVATAPVNLIYVAEYSKMANIGSEKDFYSATDTGFISQNVYLYCASKGLATVVRGWVDRKALGKAMNLRPDQKIILAQTVGYEK